ncbi:ASKHA domain-containing protein [Desulfolutivibrio sp.]|uniref:ASKHA domain-containing protein n=1 Tax=Desulfolutivibrio sp. TaxID=2773296 RepID=UPI002F966348
MDADLLVSSGRSRRTVPLAQGDTLAQALFRAGYFVGRPLCSGIGRCGACRVRFVSGAPTPVPQDARRLGPGELAEGWRLSCAHPALAAAGGEILAPSDVGPGPALNAPLEAAHGVSGGYILGLDLGTTGLAWRAVPTSGGGPGVEGQAPNPQLGAGSEIMSRLAFAARDGGADILRDLILDFLRRVAASLPGPLAGLGVAGNPAMIHLLLGLDFSGLAAAPYRLFFRGGGETVLAPDLPPAYVPPLLGPFVGADTSAGLFAILRGGAKPPFLLADFGTNGEFVLALPDGRFLAASVPMGPALEGVGPRLGRVAGPGAAVGFDLTPAGLVPAPYRDGSSEADVTAIGGTGYLSLLARLVSVGVLRPDGRFAEAGSALSPLGGKILAGLTHDRGEPRLDMGRLSLWASDVEEVQKVKAACNLAFSGLFKAAGLGVGALTAIHLAGAFGSHVSPDDLEALGFLPSGGAARCRVAGNTSLDGVCLLTADAAARRDILETASRVEVVDLASAIGPEDFGQGFVKRMVFRYVA